MKKTMDYEQIATLLSEKAYGFTNDEPVNGVLQLVVDLVALLHAKGVIDNVEIEAIASTEYGEGLN